MRGSRSQALVIDACVARSAGGSAAEDPLSRNSREVLTAVLEICHRMVWSRRIGEEWKRNRSRFSRQWQVQMWARRKVDRISGDENLQISDRVLAAADRQRDRVAMEKDLHLIEAALASSKIIISHDETAREAFSLAASKVHELKDITWINPDCGEEDVVAWLQAGAKPERHREFIGKNS